MTPTIQGVHWAPPTASSSQREFGFGETGALASYLVRLGISHLYALPYLKARPGSTHGYGVTDHNALHPELGRRGRFRAHGAALRANWLGQILNVPPWSLCHYPSSGAPSFGARPTATSC
jgi:maltooligosyltrehalose synthase